MYIPLGFACVRSLQGQSATSCRQLRFAIVKKSFDRNFHESLAPKKVALGCRKSFKCSCSSAGTKTQTNVQILAKFVRCSVPSWAIFIDNHTHSVYKCNSSPTIGISPRIIFSVHHSCRRESTGEGSWRLPGAVVSPGPTKLDPFGTRCKTHPNLESKIQTCRAAV